MKSEIKGEPTPVDIRDTLLQVESDLSDIAGKWGAIDKERNRSIFLSPQVDGFSLFIGRGAHSLQISTVNIRRPYVRQPHEVLEKSDRVIVYATGLTPRIITNCMEAINRQGQTSGLVTPEGTRLPKPDHTKLIFAEFNMGI